MPSVALQHARHIGHSVDTGQCVPFVRMVTGLPPTTWWRRGDPVQDSQPAPGTAIATFNAAGRYSNALDGSAHAAILLACHDDGSLTVVDQWIGQPVHERVLRDRHGRGDACNDASRFYVIELAEE